MRISGHFQDGKQSRRQAAVLLVKSGTLRIVEPHDVALEAWPLHAVQISTRLGSTPRVLRFPNDSSFETDDHTAVERIQGAATAFPRWLHRVESRLGYLAAALILAAGVAWGAVQWGVPALARHVAFALPHTVGAHAERAALAMLDGTFLAPSRLEADAQYRLQQTFAPYLEATAAAPRMRVLFRDGSDTLGANALALPGGSIVLTDQLVTLAANDEELIAVLAHEAGHVARRHGLRRSIQASALGTLALLVVGDVSSIPSVAAAVPLILAERGYSRAFEREADQYARVTLRRHGIDPGHLAALLRRLDPAAEHDHGYLSTHPSTRERAEALLAIER